MIAHTSTSKRFIRFWLSIMTYIDLLSIIPYYVDLISPDTENTEIQRFAILRVLRIFRLMKCLKYSSALQAWIELIALSFKKSRLALVAWLFFFCLIIMTFSSLIYYAERGTFDTKSRVFKDINGNPTKFSSIPATFWFVAEVSTTLGFGDIVPLTVFGKILTVPLMMCGILFIAFPSIIVGKNFADAWVSMKCSSLQAETSSQANSDSNSVNQDILLGDIGNTEMVTIIGTMIQETKRNQLVLDALLHRFNSGIHEDRDGKKNISKPPSPDNKLEEL